jgi:hypothetical protein
LLETSLFMAHLLFKPKQAAVACAVGDWRCGRQLASTIHRI